MFTTPMCAFCHTLKQFLIDYDIKFKEFNVAEDAEARKEMIEKSGQMEVPIVEIDGEIVIGLNKKKILKLLNIKE